MAKDYYQVLGVDKQASKEDIKKAFRKLAQKHHPDRGGDESQFKEVNEAYQVLSDDKKRAEYDTYGQTFGGGGAGAGGFGFGGQGFGDVNVDLGDIFGEFFGGGRGQRRAKRGSDISIDIEIPFKDSIFGVERQVKLTKGSVCESCQGSGAKTGTEMTTCAKCSGKGSIHEARQTILGSFTAERVCEDCTGSGSIPKDRCAECHGDGILRNTEEIELAIPAGINHGEMIRMNGFGEAVKGGQAGDLYIKIHVESHPKFSRQGYDLTMDLPVKLSDALLGAEYQVATLENDISLKIPAGVSHGEILRVKGKGVPYNGSKRGNILIRVTIQMPQSLSRRAKEHIEQLRKEGL